MLLGACGFGPVDVAAHQPLPGTEETCASLVAGLPEVVSDAVLRDVTPPSDGVAAWGQPPIILRCGVAEPTGLDPTLAVLSVAGVDWRSLDGAGGTFFFTTGQATVVEVAVPDDYAPEADVLVDLAPAVTEALADDATPS